MARGDLQEVADTVTVGVFVGGPLEPCHNPGVLFRLAELELDRLEPRSVDVPTPSSAGDAGALMAGPAVVQLGGERRPEVLGQSFTVGWMSSTWVSQDQQRQDQCEDHDGLSSHDTVACCEKSAPAAIGRTRVWPLRHSWFEVTYQHPPPKP